MNDEDLDQDFNEENEAYEIDPSILRKAVKLDAARKREIKDKLEMLAWKREYGLSDEDFDNLMN